MSNYIEREDALIVAEIGGSKETIKTNLRSIPSADVVEVRHGHWKVVNDGYGGEAYICECSECEDTVWVYKNSDRKWNYCPNCGAKMDEKEKDHE